VSADLVGFDTSEVSLDIILTRPEGVSIITAHYTVL